ncbi:MAG: flagellar hook-basal body protein [Planctomycetota bacterium]|jgi:flagellar basal body rod protein FlgG
MNYGMYLSAGGALTNLYRQDVIAGNLANLRTTGFKPDMVVAAHRRPERLERPVAGLDPQRMLERLGGGLRAAPTRIDLRQGPLAPDGGPLDLAIEGEGFFTVRTGRGDDAETLRLTRDGRLAIGDDGALVTAASGHPVLDTRGRPIRLDPTSDVAVDPRGVISQNDRAVAQLGVAAPTDATRLRKVGHNLLRAEGLDPLRPADGLVRQGHTEGSAVDPVITLNDLITATKSAQANLKMMQYHDHIIGQSVNTFGRVA